MTQGFCSELLRMGHCLNQDYCGRSGSGRRTWKSVLRGRGKCEIWIQLPSKNIELAVGHLSQELKDRFTDF